MGSRRQHCRCNVCAHHPQRGTPLTRSSREHDQGMGRHSVRAQDGSIPTQDKPQWPAGSTLTEDEERAHRHPFAEWDLPFIFCYSLFLLRENSALKKLLPGWRTQLLLPSVCLLFQDTQKGVNNFLFFCLCCKQGFSGSLGFFIFPLKLPSLPCVCLSSTMWLADIHDGLTQPLPPPPFSSSEQLLRVTAYLPRGFPF